MTGTVATDVRKITGRMLDVECTVDRWSLVRGEAGQEVTECQVAVLSLPPDCENDTEAL
jgi:hypothetical protein